MYYPYAFCVYASHPSCIFHVSLRSLLHLSLLALSLFSLSPSLSVSRSVSPSSFDAVLSVLLRSDALALLHCYVLFALGLWQIAIREFIANGLATAVVRVSVTEVGCVHAPPPKCRLTLQIACTLSMSSVKGAVKSLHAFAVRYKSSDCTGHPREVFGLAGAHDVGNRSQCL